MVMLYLPRTAAIHAQIVFALWRMRANTGMFQHQQS
jgi:hypothetical protein